LEYYYNKVDIIIEDKGIGFNQLDTQEPGTMRPDGKGEQRVGGFGLVLIEALADKVDFTHNNPPNGGTIVRASVALNYPKQIDCEKAKQIDLASTEGNIVLSIE
jgi:anti-sigma regulatory factor (Ser/Thr protein kinase)